MSQHDASYQAAAPEPAAVAARPGLLLLDFGTDWCGHCMAARAAVDDWVHAHAGIDHLRVEDGRGRPLGRAYRVKLWPTLVLLRDGEEIARAVRPRAAPDFEPLDAALR
ncbi:thioredoxin family protein [Luteimonas sp. 50]|uniref:Thioredoxin family protein n=1 Tax=Cognatiluteimonas sedimenti TaxID=2927791 RepID=A0ABT0A719_9GAMM|nr:thioredoxin family protein [Lysobacter sedimenti]MCJ0826781.1 thioredoxin family protein [Lysobacter sedimenti]